MDETGMEGKDRVGRERKCGRVMEGEVEDGGERERREMWGRGWREGGREDRAEKRTEGEKERENTQEKREIENMDMEKQKEERIQSRRGLDK